MILLCGGEGAAGFNTGGAFFLLVSYAGRDGRGQNGIAAVERRRAASIELAGEYRKARPAPRSPQRGFLHSV